MSKVKSIETNNGIYIYTEKEFEVGRKDLCIRTCTENLLLIRQIFDKINLKFGIIFGTLLGAVREENFISYDEDVDIFITSDQKDKLIDTLHFLRGNGFEVTRFQDSLLSLKRGGEYIDVYIFRENKNGMWACLGYRFESFYMKNLDKIQFLGEEFACPNNPLQFLEFVYGRDWRTPTQNFHAPPQTLPWIRKYLVPLMPKSILRIAKFLLRYN